MNTRVTLEFIKSKTFVREATSDFMDDHHLGADQYHTIQYKFCESEKNDLNTWEKILFYDNNCCNRM